MTKLTLTIVDLLVLCGLASACTPNAQTASSGPNTPGWTGQRVVPGNNSTIEGDQQGTYLQQKWPYGGRR